MISVIKLGGKREGVDGASQTIVVQRKGRGYVILDGLTRVNNPITLILHSDTILPKNWYVLVEKAINQECVGGGFSLSFDKQTKYLTFLSKLSDLYYKLTGEFWGDRAMFIKTDVLKQIVPKVPLMEDVIISKRMKKYGETIILSEKVVTSAIRFQKPLKHTFKIIKVRLLYSLGVSPKKLFRMYYK